jgi:hypothetical protein
MQLQSQCVRVQLQEYRGNRFIKGTSKQFRVYNVSVDELMKLVHRSVEKEAGPTSQPQPPVPIVGVPCLKSKLNLLATACMWGSN